MCQHAVVRGVERFVDWTSENLHCTKTDTWIEPSTFPSAFVNSCQRVTRPRICCEPSVVLTVVKTVCVCAEFLRISRSFAQPTVWKSEGSLSSSQQPTAVSYPEPWELGPQHHVPLLCKFHFNIIFRFVFRSVNKSETN